MDAGLNVDAVRILPTAEIGRVQNDLVDKGQLKGAEKALKGWLEMNPPNAEERSIRQLELGRVLFWQGKPTEAKGHLEEALNKDPKLSWARSMLGQVEVRLGNFDRAKQLFEDALVTEGGNHEAQRFLKGDTHSQAQELREMLTHGKMSPRDRIKFAEICAAIDFKRGLYPDLEKEDPGNNRVLTQQFFDRWNIMLDQAEVGDEIDSEMTLRGSFDRAEEVVFYTSGAIGDAVLGLSSISAIAKYFERHPEKVKPVEIVTPHAELFAGLEEKYSFVKVKKMGGFRDAKESEFYANDLRSRTKKVFAFSNSGSETFQELEKARHGNVVASVDMFVDRFSRDFSPWQSPLPPYDRLTSYPAKMFRFTEMLLGEKLVDNPSQASIDLPPSRRIMEKGSDAKIKYNLGDGFHCVGESASTETKKFSPEQLEKVLTGMVLSNRQHGKEAKIAFIKDIFSPQSFADRIPALPEDIRKNIVVIEDDIETVAGLLNQAETVLYPDTGLAHVAGAFGKNILMVFTMADPYLWNVGRDNVKFIASKQALAAHDNLTPVNMINWGDTGIAQQAFTPQEILANWGRIMTH